MVVSTPAKNIKKNATGPEFNQNCMGPFCGPNVKYKTQRFSVDIHVEVTCAVFMFLILNLQLLTKRAFVYTEEVVITQQIKIYSNI